MFPAIPISRVAHSRLRLAIPTAAIALLALAGPVSAHVTVNPGTATQGGFAKLTFRVPTERSVATTKLEVAFPADQPLVFVNIKPHVGWSHHVTKTKLAKPITAFGEQFTEVVSRITWTAMGSAIQPGEFDEFDVQVGPLPSADRMVFKALQTYSDGEVVRWIESRTPGAAEPEHPAPVLTLTAASSPTPAATPTPVAVSTAPASGDPVTASRVDSGKASAVSWLALGLGALALAISLGFAVRSRRA